MPQIIASLLWMFILAATLVACDDGAKFPQERAPVTALTPTVSRPGISQPGAVPAIAASADVAPPAATATPPLAASSSPQELWWLLPLTAEHGWVAFLEQASVQRGTGCCPAWDPGPYELWLVKEDGTSKLLVDQGRMVAFAGWLNAEEFIYAVSSQSAVPDSTHPLATATIYLSNTRTGIRQQLASFAPPEKSAEPALLPYVIQLSPDGKTLAYGDVGGIVLYDLTTGQERRLLQSVYRAPARPGCCRGFFAPRWAPDGRSLLVGQIGYEGGGDLLVDRDGKEIGGVPWDSSWSPDGTKLAVAMAEYGFGNFGIGVVSTKDLAIVDPVLFGRPEDRDGFAANFQQPASHDLAAVPVFGGAISEPRWSRDGSTLVFCGTKNSTSNVYTITSAGTDLKQLTDVRSDDLPGMSDRGACHPIRTSDGMSIGYAVGGKSGGQEVGIWRVRSDGNERKKLYP